MSYVRRLAVTTLAALAAVGVLISSSHAQIGRPPKLKVATDYHLLHVGNTTYRYNSSTGETQTLSTVAQNTGIGYAWNALPEPQGAPDDEAVGRYEVAPVESSVGVLVRIDTTTGATWLAQPNNGLHWESVIH